MKLKNLEYRSLWYKKIYYYLNAGQSLSQAVATAAGDENTHNIAFGLQEGISLSVVCQQKEFTAYFSFTEKSLVAVGEKTGSMKEICLCLSLLLKSQYLQKQKLIAAAIYPIMVIIMALFLLLIILIVIVPKIGPLFSGMKELPIATKVLVGLSAHVIHYWYVDLIIFAALYLLHYCSKKNNTYIKLITSLHIWMCWYLPYIKDVYMFWYIERWMRIMHLCLSSHVPIDESLLYSGKSINNIQLQKYFLHVRDMVLLGHACSRAMETLPTSIYLKLKEWISIIASGEKTGSLTDVFYVSHTHIQENLIESIDRFQKIIEPILIIIVGIMVLVICLSIILPMYQLTQSLQ